MKLTIYILLFTTACFIVSCSEGQNKTQNNAANISNTNNQQSVAKTSYKYAEEGSRYFTQKNYQKAIEPYQKAIDLEKEQPKLDQNLWRAVVDNLAMSYGITGDYQKAKDTLEYGISKDSEYPMFYYIMSNVYAEMGDEDNAIVYLKRAFERKGNMIPGETFPDPRKDDSFKNLIKSEKFNKALKELK